MKDIIENRSRISLRSKLKLAGITLRENGLLWSAFMGLYYAGSGIAEASFQKAASLRKKKNLSGMNSKSANKFIWENWDWNAHGEEWTPSPEWKASVVRTFLEPSHRRRCARADRRSRLEDARRDGRACREGGPSEHIP